MLAVVATAAGPGIADPGGDASAGEPDSLAARGTPRGTPGIVHGAVGTPTPDATVTLLTGDRVRLTGGADGSPEVTVLDPDGRTGGNDAFVEFAWAGDQYVVPAGAMPYLGSTLDPRLFNVSYLARARLDDAHATALPVTFTGSRATASGLPGAKVTRAGTGRAAVALAKSEAGALGRLLGTQWRASRAGRSGQPVGELAGITGISLAPPAVAPRLPAKPTALPTVQPTAPRYHTLTLRVLDQTGAPGTAAILMQNVDDMRLSLFQTSNDVLGSFSVSVPAGTYSVGAAIFTPHGTDVGFDAAEVVQPEVTVGANTTVTLDARTAVPYQMTVDPTVDNGQQFRNDFLTYTRTSHTGGSHTAGSFLRLRLITPNPDPGVFASRILATPTTQPVTKGSFGFDAWTWIQDRDVAAPDYLLHFPFPTRIPDSLTFTVPARDLTTVHRQIYRIMGPECQVGGLLAAWSYTPWSSVGTFMNQGAPGATTDYYYSHAPDLTRFRSEFTGCSGWVGPLQVISHGGQIHEEWGRGPTVPTAVAPRATDLPDVAADLDLLRCQACRQDDNVVLNLAAAGDSDPSHYTYDLGGQTANTLSFHRDGELALSSDAYMEGFNPLGLVLPMLPEAANYRLEWTRDTGGEAATTSAWTFRSSRTDPVAALPANEQCAPDITRQCSFLPLLFVGYDVPLNHESRAPAGAALQVGMTVGHQQHQGPPTGVSVTVSVSYDDGATWSEAVPADARGDNAFSATIAHPPLADTNGFVSLRVHVRDAAGSALDQTIIRAYGLTE